MEQRAEGTHWWSQGCLWSRDWSLEPEYCTGPGAFGDNALPNFFCAPHIMSSSENFIKTYNESKNPAPLKMFCIPPNLKTWLRAWYRSWAFCKEPELELRLKFRRIRSWSSA